ncbi:hypothetical protein QJS10_CPB14g01381 [Acorus calamus]|uniref:Uncharacterized protein n=1 Tax=Acorus calamus TaxID=4465 RepID=A0AAV9DB39_ACOCL|nr:hypothetical protein QJS10_CPB14g01381 [Acorus calamus]
MARNLNGGGGGGNGAEIELMELDVEGVVRLGEREGYPGEKFQQAEQLKKQRRCPMCRWVHRCTMNPKPNRTTGFAAFDAFSPHARLSVDPADSISANSPWGSQLLDLGYTKKQAYLLVAWPHDLYARLSIQ